MRRGRAPSREPSGSGGPQWDDPNGQLPGTGIPGDTGDSLYRSSSLRRRRAPAGLLSSPGGMSDVGGTLTPPGLPLSDPPRVSGSYGTFHGSYFWDVFWKFAL